MNSFGPLARRLALKRLRADGLCRPNCWMRLPDFPHRVGVIAAPGSAARTATLRALHRRLPSQDVVFCPAPLRGVQDSASVTGLVTALGYLQQVPGVEVIIVAHRGGPARNLMALNDERACRALFACPVPVVTAIGHCSERPNCDHVVAATADTPTKAAEYAIPLGACDLPGFLPDREGELLEVVCDDDGYHGPLDLWGGEALPDDLPF